MTALKLQSLRPQVSPGRDPFHVSSFPGGTEWTRFYRIAGEYLLRFPDFADFIVPQDGAVITCWPVPGVSEATVQHLYINQVMPLVLSKQGKLAFHASAVEVEDGALAFVAEAGRGKSTIAASFAVNGERFITDDGLILDQDGAEFVVSPGHPSIRLWKDSQDALVGFGAQTAPPLPFTSKARVLAQEELPHCNRPLPLRAVFFLGDGSANSLTIQRLSEASAMLEWVRHSFLLDFEDRPILAQHFDGVAKLAASVPCYHLDYPRRYEHVPNVLAAIKQHVASEEVVAWNGAGNSQPIPTSSRVRSETRP